MVKRLTHAALAGLLFLVGLGLGGCGLDGVTCGQGRCPSGTTCMSVLGRDPSSQYNKAYDLTSRAMDRVENEWWCQEPCPGSMSGTCPSGTCLLDPADDHDVVCGGNSMNVVYSSSGKILVNNSGMNQCLQYSSYQLCTTDSSGNMGPCSQTCQAGGDCPDPSAPLTFTAGQTIPIPFFSTTVNGTPMTLSVLNQTQIGTQPLASVLPTNTLVRIYADNDCQ